MRVGWCSDVYGSWHIGQGEAAHDGETEMRDARKTLREGSGGLMDAGTGEREYLWGVDESVHVVRKGNDVRHVTCD